MTHREPLILGAFIFAIVIIAILREYVRSKERSNSIEEIQRRALRRQLDEIGAREQKERGIYDGD